MGSPCFDGSGFNMVAGAHLLSLMSIVLLAESYKTIRHCNLTPIYAVIYQLPPTGGWRLKLNHLTLENPTLHATLASTLKD